MYGMTGKLTAQTGRRKDFVAILLKAAQMVGEMPGCRMYAVTEDMADDNTIWVMEVWEDKEAHDDSLKREDVRALIAQAMPLIDGKPDGAELRIVGGHGVP